VVIEVQVRDAGHAGQVGSGLVLSMYAHLLCDV
jgi:hypothetical protein